MEKIAIFIEEFWPAIAAIGAATLGIFYKSIAKFIYKKVYLFLTRVKQMFLIPSSCPIPHVSKLLFEIQKELKPNGGGSLRDVINRIEKELKKTSKKVSYLQISSEIMSDTLDIRRWAADKDGKLNFVNTPLKHLIGDSNAQSYYGDGWTNFVAKEDRDSAIHEWNRCVASGIDYHDTFFVQNSITGKKIKISSHAKVAKSESGQIEGWLGIIIPHDDNS